MNWGIKLSALAVAGLFSVGASAVNFDEGVDGDLSGQTLAAFAGGGIYTVGGTLDLSADNTETDPFSFEVADNFQIDSISLSITNVASAVNPALSADGLGGDFEVQFQVFDQSGTITDALIATGGAAAGTMAGGPTADICNNMAGAMAGNCVFAQGDGSPAMPEGVDMMVIQHQQRMRYLLRHQPLLP